MNALVSSLSLVGLTLLAVPLQAQKPWLGEDGLGGNGDWTTPGNWQGGVPTNTTANAQGSRFYLSETLTKATSVIKIKASEAALTRDIFVGLGKSMTFQLGANASLATGTLSYFGLGATSIPGATGTGASTTIFTGPASGSASLSLSMFYVGVDADYGGHSLTFSGNLIITDSSTSFSSVGTRATENSLTVSGGAQLTRYGLRIGSATGSMVGNTATVTGENSQIVVNGGGASNRGFLVGNIGGTDYNQSAHENRMEVRAGALFQVTTGAGGTTTNSAIIGGGAKARSNSIRIADAGSVMELAGSSTLVIGDNTATNLGGNSVQIGSGGTLRSDGAITIYDYNTNGGLNDGQNRITVESGGTLTSNSTLTTYGLLQLAEGGTLAGATLTGSTAALELTVGKKGRFELAGSGLGSAVTTTVNEDGTVAVGLEGATAASRLDLDSQINFLSGSTLELSLFAPGSADTIELKTNGAMLLTGDVTLTLTLENGLTPAAGDSWTLFSGNTSAITGEFDLSQLDREIWDVSAFNQAGGWKLTVIPEPSTYAFLALGMGCSAFLARRRQRQAHGSVNWLSGEPATIPGLARRSKKRI